MSVPDWMIDTPAASVDDMAALIRRLVRDLRKAAPDNDLSEKALDYLRRHGLTGDILRATPPAAPAATEGASKPFGYYIHIPAEQRGEFVHDLDEALDDLTNCECKITELFDHATPAPAVGASPEPANCEGCNGHGMVGGLRQDGYHSEECPFCKGSGRQSASVGASVQPVLASLSDEQIDSALHELHGVAVEYDVHDYGLPMHDDGEVHRMRSVIRALASSTPTKGGEASC